MDLTNQQVALIAIFVVLTGAVAFNLTNLTGQAIKEGAVFQVQPVLLDNGENLRMSIHPGKEGTTNKVEFFTNGMKVGETPNFCDEQRCMGSVAIVYEIPMQWEPGLYVAHVFDYTSGSYVQDYFTVE